MMTLPDYDGRDPEGYRLNFSGQAENLTDAMDLDSSVVLIVRGKVKDPAFKTNQFGVLRLHQRVVVDFAEVADEVTAERLMREIKRRQDDEAGQTTIDDADLTDDATDG